MRILIALALIFQSQVLYAEYYFYNDQIQKTYPLQKRFNLNDLPQPTHRKTAVIVGAGPAGLMGALVLKQEDFEVVVLEKRSGDFNRLNMVNLKAESESALAQLGLLEAFRLKIGTRIKKHDYFKISSKQKTLFHSETVENLQGRFQEDLDFTPEVSQRHFGSDGLYTITIAEFEKFLADQAAARGIQIVTDTVITQLTNLPGSSAKGILAVQKNGQTRTFQPDLLVLSDGAHGITGDKILSSPELPGSEGELASDSGTRPPKDSSTDLAPDLTTDLKMHKLPPQPCDHENWIFGNVAYESGDEAFVSVLLDYSNKPFIQIANVIFDPRHREANIAVSVDRTDLSPMEIKAQIEAVATQAFTLNRISARAKVRFTSAVVPIVNRIAERLTLGSNVLIAGDRAGTSSPLAGLGATLAVTSYPYGIRKVARAIQSDRPEIIQEALKNYRVQTRAYIQKWLDTSAGVKRFIEKMAEESEQ